MCNNKSVSQATLITLIKSHLDPHYAAKAITKDQYKEIVGKCVTKVLGAASNNTGEVAKSKLKPLVDGYVAVYKHRLKKMTKTKDCVVADAS